MNSNPLIAIVGGGPAGLMAAEQLSQGGVSVQVFDAMPSVGRKLLMAGRGGLNLTHSEPLSAFVGRYGAGATDVADWLQDFGPQALRDWVAGLGIETFVGSSGRVFPTDMKAAPLLRAWLHRLRQPTQPGAVPVRFHMRHRWTGLEPPTDGTGPLVLGFDTPEGPRQVPVRAVVLALGGASWPRLGSDGAWLAGLQARGVATKAWQPANCGFDVWGRSGQGWTPFFAERFAGHPMKNAVIRLADESGAPIERRGEFVITTTGVEGSLIYAVSQPLRDRLLMGEPEVGFALDLQPDRSPAQVLAAVSHPRGRRSLGAHLKSRLGLGGVHSALLHELLTPTELADATTLAQAIKALPIRLRAPRPVAEAISSAGGVCLRALDERLMLRAMPGVFCAGEMLDWEAPTGGYLLTAALASGVRVGRGVQRWLLEQG